MDSSSGNFIAGGTVGDTNFAFPFGPFTQDTNWFFDDSTELTVCSDISGKNPIGCNIQNLQVGYSLKYVLDESYCATSMNKLLLIQNE